MNVKPTIVFLLLLTLSVQAQQFKTPVDYLGYIGKETGTIARSTWKYTTAVAHSKSARKIDATRKQLLKTMQLATKKIEALKDGYQGDTEYRDQILTYLDLCEKQINQEYDKIINMQEVAEQSYDAMEAYVLMRDMVNNKLDQAQDALISHQKLFANKYNIHISEDTSELGKKMKISNEVFENHTQLFLIFFRSNITETQLMMAIADKDLNAIQQNAAALQSFSDQGLEKLKTFKAYKNDPMLVNATKKYLEFAKKEAIELGSTTVTFMMNNQQLDEQKKVLEATAEKDRTREQIDNFNKLVNAANKEIGSYNRTNQKYNQERAAAIQNWNQNGTGFIAKHVPEN